MTGLEKIKVKPILESLEYINQHQSSVARFGDGEIDIICGASIPYQSANEQLAKRLLEILQTQSTENLLVCLPDVFQNIERYNANARAFWSHHFEKYGDFYKKECHSDWYGSTFISRPYIDLVDKSHSDVYFKKLKELWANQDILIVEGEKTQSGVGNDLFDSAKSIKRIIAPSKNAFDFYDDLLISIENHIENRLVLLMLGPTAKPLVFDLAKKGYRAIDLGHIDSEYEWFKMGATHKVKFHHKHTAEYNQDSDIQMHYDKEYLDSILDWVGVEPKTLEENNKELISVVVPVYNVEAYLRRCVDSLLKQTYERIEIILINDGSTDGSAAICEEYAQQSPRVRAIHQKNQGVSAARNYGIELARGKYIAFVDSDDFVHETYLEKLHYQLITTDSDISATNFTSFNEERQTFLFFHNEENYFEKIYSPQEWIDAETSMQYNLHLAVTFSHLKLYKKSLFKNVRFPVGRLREDDASLYKVYLLANQIAFVNEGPYYYSQRSDGLSRTSMKDDIATMVSNVEERIALLNLLGFDTSAQVQSYYRRIEACAKDAIESGQMDLYRDLTLKLELAKKYREE